MMDLGEGDWSALISKQDERLVIGSNSFERVHPGL